MGQFVRYKIAGALIAASVVIGAGSAWTWYTEHRAERLLVVASGPRQSEVYAFATALSDVVRNHDPRLNLRVIETYGSEENITLLADDTAQLAIVAGSTTLGPAITVVDFLFPELVHLIARHDLHIQSAADLGDRVVGLPPAGSTSRTLFWRLVRHYGLGSSDIKTLTIETREAKEALRDASIDAYFVISAVGSPWIADLLAEAPARLVPIAQAAALNLTLPALRSGEIPMGTYDGARPTPSDDLPTVAERTLLVASPATDRDAIRDLVRILHEARQDLVAADLRAALIERVDDPFEEGLPINPGAAEYFRRDNPLFVVRYAETMGFLLSAGVLLFSTLWHVKQQSDRKAKNRADTYNAQIIELTEQAENAATRQELDMVKQELLVIFRRVFSDLDEDLISSTAIQGFTLAWYTAVQIVQNRRSTLPEEPSSAGGQPHTVGRPHAA
jgi:TRAP transporter TAXI family solute receptor